MHDSANSDTDHSTPADLNPTANPLAETPIAASGGPAWAQWLTILGAALLGASTVLTMPWHYIGLGMCISGLLAARFPLHRFPLRWPALALALWLVIAAQFAPYGHLKRIDGIVYALPVLLSGWAIAHNRRMVQALLIGLLIGVTLSGILGILQFIIGYDGSAKPWRVATDGLQQRYATGFMAHWIRYGLMMGLAGLTLLILGPLVWRRRLIWPWAGLAIICTLISGARGAILALAAGLGLGLALGGGWKRALIAGGAALAAAISGMWIIAQAAPQRVEMMLRGEDIRLTTWGHIGELMVAHPWFGVGPKGVQVAYQQGIEHAGFHSWNPGHAHNGFMQIALTGGLPALALFVVLLGWMTTWLWRQRHHGHFGHIGWRLGLAVMALWMVGSLTEDAFGLSTIRNAPLLILGVACGLGSATWPAREKTVANGP